MKTKHFVVKYKLDRGNKFSHPKFVADLANVFDNVLAYYGLMADSEGNIPTESHDRQLKFKLAVAEMRRKFDAISNKTAGNKVSNHVEMVGNMRIEDREEGGLPETLWNYFFATVVIGRRNVIMPWLAEKEKKNEKA